MSVCPGLSMTFWSLLDHIFARLLGQQNGPGAGFGTSFWPGFVTFYRDPMGGTVKPRDPDKYCQEASGRCPKSGQKQPFLSLF